MFKNISMFLAIAVLLLGLPTTLKAQTDSTCLEKVASRIKKGDKIEILRWDGQKIKGYLTTVDSLHSALSIDQIVNGSYVTHSHQVSEIREIRYKGPAGFQPIPLLIGVVAGAGIGAAIGSASEKSNFVRGVITARGAVVGGIVGLVVAGVVTSAVGSTKSIECSSR